jgi:predicted enzyme related to lactoylglutathione lyase
VRSHLFSVLRSIAQHFVFTRALSASDVPGGDHNHPLPSRLASVDRLRSEAGRYALRPVSIPDISEGHITLRAEAATLRILVNIDVDDLEKAIEFYTTALGLRLGRRLFEGSVAEIVGATSTIHLLSKPSGTGAVPNSALCREYRRHWTPVHLDFEVEDACAAVERALRAGAQLEGEIQSFPWGRLALMGDPFGHGFCVLQFFGNGYDDGA